MHKDMIIAVDRYDNQVNCVEKNYCHREGILHRAVSGFIFKKNGDLLLQKRSSKKYHAAMLWANSCCSHPRPGEAAAECMRRRTQEELGLDVTFTKYGQHRYTTQVSEEMFENELVHLFIGVTSSLPTPVEHEVAEIMWIDETHVLSSHNMPGPLAPWFAIYLEKGIVAQAFHCAKKAYFRDVPLVLGSPEV